MEKRKDSCSSLGRTLIWFGCRQLWAADFVVENKNFVCLSPSQKTLMSNTESINRKSACAVAEKFSTKLTNLRCVAVQSSRELWNSAYTLHSYLICDLDRKDDQTHDREI